MARPWKLALLSWVAALPAGACHTPRVADVPLPLAQTWLQSLLVAARMASVLKALVPSAVRVSMAPAASTRPTRRCAAAAVALFTPLVPGAAA